MKFAWKGRRMGMFQILMVMMYIAGCWARMPACFADEIVVEEYPPQGSSLRRCTHLLINGDTEIITANNRLFYRNSPGMPFLESPLKGLKDAHSVAFNPREELFYVTDTGNHQLRTFRDPAVNQWTGRIDSLAGVQLDRPHDIVVDEKTGWLYCLNPNSGIVFRFKSLKQEATLLDLSKHRGYSRALTIANGKLYVIGSSRGLVIEVDDFDKKKYTIHRSFGKKKDAPAGSWKATGLVINDVDFYEDYWYATSYFCPDYARGEDCDENKFIRFKTWQDFEAGTWEDLSQKLPRDMVPYYLTVSEDSLFIAVFQHEQPRATNTIYQLTK